MKSLNMKSNNKVFKICRTYIWISISIILVYKIFISGHAVPKFGGNSISKYETVNLGGNNQSILIRGDDVSKPVLLYLHGGPGNPETSFIVPCQTEWEKHFVVVNYDQIGSGRSYNNNLKSKDITGDRICSNTMELVHYLQKEFNVKKIYIVAHSYGTYVGMKCVAENPEDFYAYIGTGQIGDQQENEKVLINYAESKAEKDNNKEALKELHSLGKMPYTKDNFGKKIGISRKWTTYYGGAIYNKHNIMPIYIKAALRPEYNVFDFIKYFKGENLYYTNTSQDEARYDLFTADFTHNIKKVDVPIYFIQGENDYITSYAVCEEYYNVIDAPKKKLFKIKNAAHNVIFEKSDEFASILINIKKDNK